MKTTKAKTSKTVAAKSNTKSVSKKVAKNSTKQEATQAPETIGNFTKSLILAGETVKAIESAIKAKFPDCGPQVNSIYFYRSKLNRQGLLGKKA